MDAKMDTKNLKHRKRQKKNKSGIDKRNNDVLVVPPDILKKLGINIGNTNFIHEITNNNNAGQNIGIVNNEATASISMPNNNKKSNESSILETANLMKKSVFLSPTFVSTVNNVIPGQVEISKIKNYDSCETDRENLPFELPEQLKQKERKNKNDLKANSSVNGDFSGMSVINITGVLDNNNCVLEDPRKPDTTAENDVNINDNATKIYCNNLNLNGTSPSDLKITDKLSKSSLKSNSFLTKDDIEAANSLNSIKLNVITNGQSGADHNDISFKGREICKGNAKPVNNVNSVEELAVLIKQTDMEIKENKIQIVAEAENNLISFEKSTVQIENLEAANNSISLEGLEIKIGQAEDENNLIELEELTTQVDQEEIQNNLISLEGCDIQLELPEDENTLISLEKSAIEIEKAEVDNIVFLEDCEINVEDKNKLVSIEDAVIQIEAVVDNNFMSETDNLITLADLAVPIEKGEVDKHWGSLEGCEMKIGTNENNLIKELQSADVGNIQISSELSEIGRDEVESVKSKTLEEGLLQLNPVEEESHSHRSTAHIEHAQIGNNTNLILIDKVSHENVSMETNLEIVCEDLKDLSTKDYKDIFALKETNVDSDITGNGQDITFENTNGDMSQISKADIVKQIQESEMEVEKTDNNNIVLSDSKNNNNVCNGSAMDSSILNDKTLKSSGDINDNAKNIPLNKAIHKVNIISEEIIPASDLNDLKRSNSPIIRSLTPVPLNTIIAPKKAVARIEKRKVKTASKLVHSPAVKVNTSVHEESTNEEKHIKKQKCEENCEKASNNKTLNKGDLKNNNEKVVYDDKEASTNKQSIENKSSITDHTRLLDLPKSVNEDKLCEDNEISDVSHISGSISEDNCFKNRNCMDNEQKSSKNDAERPLDTKSNSNVNISKDTSISNPESESKQQNKIQNAEKKRKKNKKATEGKSIVVNTAEDKEFCDTQINNIVKSTKECDATAHLDKVKEIAEYIKRYAHVYKDNKKGISKHINKETNNVKDSINSKTSMIKSKLCIQGVEKPGGNKVEKELSGTKVLKTYTRHRKQQNLISISTVDKNDTITCNIVDATETELNLEDISTSNKTQDFCLCYDFGRLDDADYDNSYEHIHFWLHNDNTDLESILSIYNDEVESVDRTKLDDLKIDEVVEDNARIKNICWNYFLNYKGDGSKNVENSNRIKAINECIKEESNKDVATNSVEIKNSGSISNMPVKADTVEQCNTSNKVDDTDTDVNMFKDVNDANLQSESDVYDVITIVEMIDGENEDILETTESNSTLNATIEETISNKSYTKDHIKKTPQETQKECPKTVTPKEDKNNKKVTLTPTDSKKEDDSENKKTEADKPTTSKTNTESKELPAISEPESSKQSDRKRKLPICDTSEEPSAKKDVKCGVCDKLLPQDKWERHVMHKHGFIAWKAGESFNFEDPVLTKKLQEKLETTGSLKCATCSMKTTKYKKYISHVKVCSQHKESRRVSTSRNLVKCGVCHQEVSYLSWNEHIGKEHNYLAWIEGQQALNVADETAVLRHLQTMLKANGGLTCSKCGLNRKRAKAYLSHVENCDGTQVNFDDSSMSVDASILEDSEPLSTFSTRRDKKTITCGVCKQEVAVVKWTEHIAKEHNYMAWDDDDTPLNVDDEEEVWNHLQGFIRQSGGLMCYKCGLNRKRVKMYLSHVKTCDGQGVDLDASVADHSHDNIEDSTNSETDEKMFECGVCHAKVTVLDWNEHIGREHNYLAWKVGATPLDVNNEDAVKEHLLHIIKSYDGLICYKCGWNRKRVKLYLDHIKTCEGSNRSYTSTNSNSMIEISIDGAINVLKCGVCAQDVAESLWFEHIGREHKYLAWEQGQEPLNLEDEDAVKDHLLYISRQNNGLICNTCQVTKKYPKTFLQHIKECTGIPALEESLKIESVSIFDVSNVTTPTVKCGVCQNEVDTDQWMTHMEVEHDYLAWLDGKDPLDLEDTTVVLKHLTEVTRKTGGLKCKKCGLVRKYAKSYMQHTESCWNGLSSKDISTGNRPISNNGTVECAVCHSVVDTRDWRDHAMKKHYNVAWVVGGTPIEINNPYGVEPCIKEYQARHNGKLVCKTCGIHRVSAVGFYAHIITCGKTEEEQEIYKNICEICNNKYLRIYRSQHMTAHREKEYAIERKLAKAQEMKKEEDEPVEIVAGRRKAAEKAKTVIEKYTSKITEGSQCSSCGFTSDLEAEMKNHVCVEHIYSGSDSDESVDLAHSSEEDDDTDVDSNISDEEREARDREMTRSRKHRDSSARIQRLPYQIRNLNTYMSKSAEEFAALHLTDKDLFPDWRNFVCDAVPEEELPRYMPPLEESCKVRLGEADTWQTYKRFEAKKEKDITTMFTGACIQCICWVPPYVGQYDIEVGPVREYLAVVTHLSDDVPRHYWQDIPPQKPALVQIWDCGNLVRDLPELVMGISLECGTIWSMDWCPSGARDVFDHEEPITETYRLGLFAVASSNGSAYVFAVPHPSTIKDKNQKFYKLTPVAELRLATCSNRKTYQATAIKWSTQKGHVHIVVGYADGTTAYFDLKNESPMLKSMEKNVTVFYPYYDERAQSMCIEDVDVFPRRSRWQAGVVAAGSVGGAGAWHARAHAAAARLRYPPHWPAALLAGDDNLVCQAINEVEWYGCGRRIGGMRACCGCAWCGRVAAVSAPVIRLLRTHPAYTDLHRQVIATLHMVPFYKRKRKNDELSMVMEPLTYEDAVAKYGIEFKQIRAKDKNTQQKLSGLPREAYPERFPLSDVTSMLFCPSARNHHKLAVATHAGLLFIMTV